MGWTLDQTRSPLVRHHRPRRPRPWARPPHGGHAAVVWPWQRVPHALMVGGTGAGKSTELFVMATSLTRTLPIAERAITLVDGQGSNTFLAFAGIGGVTTANGPDEFAEAVATVHAIMLERIKELDQARQRAAATRGRAPWKPPKWLHLWVDEFLIATMRLEGKARTDTTAKLIDIALGGRKVRVRLLLAAQRPDAKSIETGLPGLLKTELKMRIGIAGELGLDSMECRMAFDDPGAADRVRCMTGGALARVGHQEVVYRVPWMADPTDPATSPEDRDAAWAALPKVEALVG